MNYENNEQTQKTNAETKEGSERTKPTQSPGPMFFLLQYSEPCPSCHLSQEAGTQRDCIVEREAGIDRESKVGKHSRERERNVCRRGLVVQWHRNAAGRPLCHHSQHTFNSHRCSQSWFTVSETHRSAHTQAYCANTKSVTR